MTLTGKRIVITRARHQAGELADLLREHGAIPILYPCIAIIPPDDPTPLDSVLMHLSAYDWMLITSANTVDIIHQHLSERGLSPNFGTIKIGAIGKSSADAVKTIFGRDVDFIPSRGTAQHLGTELPMMRGEKIFLPQSEIANPVLADILIKRGGIVTAMSAYQTVIDSSGDDLPALLAQNQVDAITFTSSSCVNNFVIKLGYVPDVMVACIGNVTAQTARDTGFSHVLVADDADLEGLLAILM